MELAVVANLIVEHLAAILAAVAGLLAFWLHGKAKREEKRAVAAEGEIERIQEQREMIERSEDAITRVRARTRKRPPVDVDKRDDFEDGL